MAWKWGRMSFQDAAWSTLDEGNTAGFQQAINAHRPLGKKSANPIG